MAKFSDVELDVTVVLGRGKIPLSALESASIDTVLELDTEFIEPVLILVNGIPKFKGEVVTIGNKFGVKIINEC
ncbi:FliM/FliN family flagellar motor switch protein [Leptospira levettii]|uniref:FliM/FliN family flagellar motor switch protein n=1 Tax=Leptospira levettii TaxID=2023178 RepID=UPI003EB9EB50